MKYISIWALALMTVLPSAKIHAIEKDVTGVYRIATPQDLVEFAAVVNNGYGYVDAKLMADLNMSGVKYTPIGNSAATSYQGTFDGQGYTIDNLVINNNDKEGQGIFGYVNNATILNLIAGPNNKIYGKAFVAGIVGDKVDEGTVTLRGCGNEGNVYCSNQNGAGLVGCVHRGTLIIDQCYNTGRIQGGWESAAFSGWAGQSQNTYITRSFNTGTVTGTDGDNNYLWRSTDPKSSEVYEVNGRQGAWVSQDDLRNGTLTWKLNGSNNPKGTFRQNLSGNQIDNNPTTKRLHNLVFAVGNLKCDGSSAGGTLTFSNDKKSALQPHQSVNGVCSVCNHVDEEYILPNQQGFIPLSSGQDLQWFAKLVNSDPSKRALNAVLTRDIDMNGTGNFPGLGDYNYPYEGEFDGNGFTIYNLRIDKPNDDNVAFIPVGDSKTWIHDLTLADNCYIRGKSNVAGFIGWVDNRKGNEIHFDRLGFEGTVDVNDNGGAMVGVIPDNGKVYAYFRSCYTTGKINGQRECGALAGWASYSVSTNCYVKVNGSGWQDGDVVRGWSPRFTNTYANGNSQKRFGLYWFSDQDMQNGTLKNKLNDSAYKQDGGKPKLKK